MSTILTDRIIKAFKKHKKKPLSLKELAQLALIKKSEQNEFLQAVDELKQAGEVTDFKGKLALSADLGLHPAKIVKVTETFGFAKLTKTEKEIFIPGRFMQGAMPGDVVLVKTTRSRNKSDLDEGEVVRFVDKADFEFTGVFVRDGHKYTVIPDKLVRFPLEVSKAQALAAEHGDKVLAKISTRGDRHFLHKVKIVKVFGKSDSAKSCCEAVLAAQGVSTEFSAEVLAEADKIARAGIHPKELANRTDLRYDVVFTIDGADSKDLDDAISLEKHENGWYLGVHIADVSYYVLPNSELDKEAFNRGTSIYYADSVIPMLPKQLSNGICSLNPNEDRLTFSAFISLDKQGKMIGYDFKKTIIRSRVKGVYSEINKIIDGTADEALKKKYYGLENTILEMNELADILIKNHFERGGLDLDSAESKIIIDENGIAVDIIPRERGKSERIIEEFMLMANQAAATFAKDKGLPFVYRVHESPSEEKLESLSAVLLALGIDNRAIKLGVAQTELSKILEQVRGKEIEKLVNNTILRSMAKARYSEVNIGHYGLVLENYSHFTSPIRRYPDLAIHRIMSAVLMNMRRDNIEKRFVEFAKRASLHSSNMELRAMNVERDCEDCYKAEYIKKFIGKQLSGVISSAAPQGIYVQLPNTIEGLVRTEDLGTGNFVLENNIQYIDNATKKRFRVGDKIDIIVAGSDVSTGNIDFKLAETTVSN